MRVKLIIRLFAASLMLFGGRADATTAIGTILTNVVSATMWDGPIGANAYTVSYNSSAYVTVTPPPRFEVFKKVSLDGVNWYPSVMAGAGTTVTFAICIFNGASVAVDEVTLMDQLPGNMVIAGNVDTTWTLPNYHMNAVAPGLSFGWDTDGWGAAMAGGMPGPPAGQGTPVYMRWQISSVDAQTSACVTYTAEVL